MTTLLLAAWIAPIDAPVIPDAAVVFDDSRILAVGPARTVNAAFPNTNTIDAGNSLLLPGLVNPHTHLELSDCTPLKPPPDSFVHWLIHVIARRASSSPPESPQPAITGIAQSLRFGVACVGDITRFPHLTRPTLANSPLHAVSYGEVQAMAQRRNLLDERLDAALNPDHASPRLRIGLSPHAPYSIEDSGYRRCLQLARQHNLPLATHLAESPHEMTFLARHAGPFRDLWTFLASWDDLVPRFDGGPIRFAQSLGLLEYPTLLAHVNYCDDDELAILAASQASVVYCPRTHAYFNHPPHRWRDMLARGINVAVGTDSCASSPDLNLVDDLRLLHRLAPDVSPETLWQMATLRAARALDQHQSLGSITPGKAPDFALFPVATRDPLREVLETHRLLPAQLWIAGRPVYPPP